MKITLHRPHQIGGCITEIESNAGTRIFIDLGHLLPDGDKPSDDKLATKDAIDKLTVLLSCTRTITGIMLSFSTWWMKAFPSISVILLRI